MKKKRLLAMGLALCMAWGTACPALAEDTVPEEEAVAVIADWVIAQETAAAGSIDINSNLPAKTAALMEQSTGKVLFAKEEHTALPPASVTKIMTLLLVMQAIDSGRMALTDTVTCSDYAAGMGGSQIWLEPGEQMTVDELLKAAAIASANDATVLLGEQIAGSESAFVDLMNQEAARLGMNDTTFKNATGLDAEGHVTSAHDIALMSAELLKYPIITNYTTVWMDNLRGGATELVNTNRLIRFYQGANGLKTGTTSGAGSCLSATATRDGLSLVAVVMGCNTSDERFAAARALLDHGFANYTRLVPPAVDGQLVPVQVEHGMARSILPVYTPPEGFIALKSAKDSLIQTVELTGAVEAPVEAGQTLGRVVVTIDGQEAGEYPLVAAEGVQRMTLWRALGVMVQAAAFMG